jgi:hypothetical protein
MAQAAPQLDPDDLLRRAVEAGRNIKFGRGVVGKTSYAVMALIPLWVAIILRLSANMGLNAVLMAAGIIASALIVWWVRATQRFAAENPAQAMLEGAELIEYQRMEAQVKGGAILAQGPKDIDAEAQIVIRPLHNG